MTHNPRFSILQGRAVKDSRISDPQFRTLAALGTYTDEDGWCFPALGTIGSDLGKSRQAVGRDVIALKNLGYVRVFPRYANNGARRSSRYQLVFDLPPLQPTVDTPATSEGASPATPEVAHKVPIEGSQENSSPPRKKDGVDMYLDFQRKPQNFLEAINVYFDLTPNWEAKYNAQFLEWATEQGITPAQVEQAAKTWGNDKRFNWQAPTLKLIQEHWRQLVPKPKAADAPDPELERLRAEAKQTWSKPPERGAK